MPPVAEPRINLAVVGVGNCASSLVQGLAHYSNGGANEQIGLMHWDLGGYQPRDIHVVAAWDVDARKVGQDALLPRLDQQIGRERDAVRVWYRQHRRS